MTDQITVKNESKPFTKVSEGTHQAVCVDIINLGYKEESYQGQAPKWTPKCAIVWQVEEINPDTGKRHIIVKEYTISFGEKARLRKDLGAWRGKSYSEDEAVDGAPLHKLESVNCMLQIEHKPSQNGTGRSYTNILSITPIPKNLPKIGAVGYERPDWIKKGAETPGQTTLAQAQPPRTAMPTSAGTGMEPDDFDAKAWADKVADESEQDLPF